MGLLRRSASLRYEITKYNPDNPDLAIFEYDIKLGCPDCGCKDWIGFCKNCCHWFIQLAPTWFKRMYL